MLCQHLHSAWYAHETSGAIKFLSVKFIFVRKLTVWPHFCFSSKCIQRRWGSNFKRSISKINQFPVLILHLVNLFISFVILLIYLGFSLKTHIHTSSLAKCTNPSMPIIFNSPQIFPQKTHQKFQLITSLPKVPALHDFVGFFNWFGKNFCNVWQKIDILSWISWFRFSLK